MSLDCTGLSGTAERARARMSVQGSQWGSNGVVVTD
jgi:hypothetical protein